MTFGRKLQQDFFPPIFDVRIYTWCFAGSYFFNSMKKDQRYQRIGEDNGRELCHDQSQSQNRSSKPYRDDPSSDPQSTDVQPDGIAPIHRARSTSTGGSSVSEPTLESHPLEKPSSQRNDRDTPSKKLRLRRGISKESMSPAGSRSGSLKNLSLSRESSAENIVILEGDLEASLDRRKNTGNDRPISSNHLVGTSPWPHSKLKDSYREAASVASSAHGDGSNRCEDEDGLLCASHDSSFDLLDDDDEINLQRYNRDFGASPYISDPKTGDQEWDDELGMENGRDVYHPRSNTGGSYSKDPYLRMVQQNNPQSPTNGDLPLSSVHSFSDFQLYLKGVRRQARHRRAQRLLTMPSEQGWQRFYFWFVTYCWDANDVGLLVLGVLLVVWFVGLLWLARVNVRNSRNRDDWGEQNGAEYNNNAEFDEFEEEPSYLYTVFKWLWWILGFVLLVRILGPFAVQNVNDRRRERRRQRYISGDMEQQQQRMHQQQIPTMVMNGAYSDDDPANNESVEGVEIT